MSRQFGQNGQDLAGPYAKNYSQGTRKERFKYSKAFLGAYEICANMARCGYWEVLAEASMTRDKMDLNVPEPDLLARVTSGFEITRSRIKAIEKTVTEEIFRSAYKGVDGPISFEQMALNVNRERERKDRLGAAYLELLARVYAMEYAPILIAAHESDCYYLTL
jgi:hypothetical protein